MAAYIASTTTTAADSSISILAANSNEGGAYEITSLDAACWVHIQGGTAAANAANCIPVPQNEMRRVDLPVGHNGLTAIRDGGTSARVTVAQLGA